MKYERSVNHSGPYAIITQGIFTGNRATVEVDYGSHARLYIRGMVMNLPESFFVRSISSLGNAPEPEAHEHRAVTLAGKAATVSTISRET